MRRALVLLVLFVCLGAGRARADEEAIARTLRRELQQVLYDGNPKAVATALARGDLGPLLDDPEALCRLLIYANDVHPRFDIDDANDEAWRAIADRVVSLAEKAGGNRRMHTRYAWAREEAKYFGTQIRSRTKQSEEDWRAQNDAIREISRTEGTGIWTTYGYFRSFDLHTRSLGIKDANPFSAAGGMVYLRAKMDQRPGLFSSYAVPVAAAHQAFVEGSLAIRLENKNWEKARKRLLKVLDGIETYVTAQRVPLAALNLHNDVVDLIEHYPGLKMKRQYVVGTPAAIDEALLPRVADIEQTLVLKLPLSRRWRVLEGRVAGRDALHLLRTRFDGSLANELTFATFEPKTKYALAGAKKPVRGSALRSLAAARAKSVAKVLGEGAKTTAPKKQAFYGKLKGGYRSYVATPTTAVHGYVGKTKKRTYLIEFRVYGDATGKLPKDVELLLSQLAHSTK